MRWTPWRQVLAPDETLTAYGEVVWSWRRDPGVYSLRLCGDGNGDNKGRSPGRARISRKPLRGESRDVSAVPVKSVCILLYVQHTAMRAQSAPGFPCALCKAGGQRDATTRAKTSRGNMSARAENSAVVPDKRAKRARSGIHNHRI